MQTSCRARSYIVLHSAEPRTYRPSPETAALSSWRYRCALHEFHCCMSNPHTARPSPALIGPLHWQMTVLRREKPHPSRSPCNWSLCCCKSTHFHFTDEGSGGDRGGRAPDKSSAIVQRSEKRNAPARAIGVGSIPAIPWVPRPTNQIISAGEWTYVNKKRRK
jgi:hypothetical protein